MRAVLACAAILAAFLTAPALAQQMLCAPRAALLDVLAERGERVVGFGLSASDQLVELLVGPAGQWSLLISNPRGVACLAGAGEGWESTPPPAPGEES